MPPKKQHLAAIRKMEAKVEVLEGEISEVRSSLAAMENAMKDMPATLIAMLEKSLRKSLQISDDSVQKLRKEGSTTKTVKEVTGEGSSGGKVHPLHGGALSEFRHSVKKVELPAFDGVDPAGWISRAEVYFRVQDTSPEVKVSLAQLCMEGATIHFFNSLLDEEEQLTWEELKGALLERYGGQGDGDVYEQLTELQQKGSMEDYITELEYLTAQIPKLPERQFQGYFLHGLKREIRGRVRSLVAMGGMSRAKLLQVTRAVEKEVKGEFGSGYPRGSKGGGSGLRPGFSGSGRTGGSDWVLVKGGQERGPNDKGVSGPKGDKPNHVDRKRSGPRDRGYSHLTYQELLERKQKGLCFKCGGPFHLMHQCPDKQLRVLIVEEGDEEDNEGKILAVEMEEGEEEIGGEMSVMSLHNLIIDNKGKPQTIRFQGKVHGVPVLILVDSGATHNFIDLKLVHRMGWEVEDTPSMNIKLGDGFQAQTRGRCRELEVEVGEFTIKCSPHLFELGGLDIVLGIEWLRLLGDTIVNWTKHTMSFWSGKKWINLQGLDGGRESLRSLQSIFGKVKGRY